MELINKNIYYPAYNQQIYTRPDSTNQTSGQTSIFSASQPAYITNPNNPPAINNSQINEVLRAQALAKINSGYKELQTFNVPFYDQGKLYQLDNGQKVVIIPKKGPVAIKTYVGVGSFNEPDNLRGISHYIEHNVFNGSNNLAPGEFVKTVNEMGAKYNASTSTAATNYYVLLPTNDNANFDQVIKLHADMLKTPKFADNMLDKERGPVISEIQMYKDDPTDIAYNLMLKNLFNIKSDYQGLIAGSEKNIKGIKKEDVIDYYKKWYTPDNMTTIIVGDVNTDAAIKTISKYFSTDKNPKTQPNFKGNLGRQYENLGNTIQQTKRIDVTNPNTKSATVNLGFIGPKNADAKETLLTEALCCALSGSNYARLSESLKPYNTSAYAGLDILRADPDSPQVIQVISNFKPGEEEQGLKTIYSSLYDITQRPLNQEEFLTVKNKLKESILSASEESMDIADLVANAMVIRGNINAYADKLKMVDELTPQDIQNAARNYLNLNKASIIVVHPAQSEKQTQNVKFTGNSSKKDISFGNYNTAINNPYSANITPQAQSEYLLPNNVHLSLNNDSSAIKSSAVIQFQTDYMPNVKPGVVDILAEMMSKGTNKYSEETLNKINDINSLGIKPFASGDSIFVAADCSDKNLPMALDIMKQILLDQNFTEEKFQKAKEEIKLAYSSLPDDPKNRAIETLYGNHPYGNTPRKVLENIDSITSQDVRDFYNYILQNAQAQAVITGSFDKTPYLQNNIFSSLSELPKAQDLHHINTFTTNDLQSTKVIAQTADRNQAHIVQMFKIKESGNVKDQAALMLLNEILGGNSQSRLFRDLRESQKLAYRVRSSYSTDGKAGEVTLEIKTSTKADQDTTDLAGYDNVKKSLEGFKKHISNFITTPVSQEELSGAKRAIKGKMTLSNETSMGKTDNILNGFNTYYGPSYTSELMKSIDNITDQDIQKAANIFLNKPSVISIAASKDTIENQKSYLNTLGSLTIC